MNIKKYTYSINLAKLQYILTFNIRGNINCGDYITQNCKTFSYGKFTLSQEDLQISNDDQLIASSASVHSSTFLIAVTIDTALENIYNDRFNKNNSVIYNASKIARILRNAFSHNPFYPKWNIDNANHIGIFEIKDIIHLDTNNLNGKEVNWRHYGGPIALIKFADYVINLLSKIKQ